MRSVTIWLIVINVAVFVIDQLLVRMGWGYLIETPRFTYLFEPLAWWGHFSTATAISNFQIWRFISFQFLHGDVYHLLFNMIALYFFGPIIESYLSSRRFLAFYLICGVAGAASYLVLTALGVLDRENIPYAENWRPLVGASAGIFGILIAAARIAPHATVLVYGILPMRLRTLAWILIAVAVYMILTRGQNAGGEAAHLGGAVIGFLLIQNPNLLDIFQGRLKRS